MSKKSIQVYTRLSVADEKSTLDENSHGFLIDFLVLFPAFKYGILGHD